MLQFEFQLHSMENENEEHQLQLDDQSLSTDSKDPLFNDFENFLESIVINPFGSSRI